MSPGLRDPLGLDGSHPPEDREAWGRALHQQLRRIQPGLAMVLDAFGHLRRGKQDERKTAPGDARPDSQERPT